MICWQNKKWENEMQQIQHHHSNRFLKIIDIFRSCACPSSMSWWMEIAFQKILEKIDKLLKDEDPREIWNMKTK